MKEVQIWELYREDDVHPQRRVYLDVEYGRVHLHVQIVHELLLAAGWQRHRGADDSRRERVMAFAKNLLETLSDPTQAWDIAVADFFHEVETIAEEQR